MTVTGFYVKVLCMRSRHIERMKRRAQLVGLDGQPLVTKAKGVPFIQWLPNGKSVGRLIDRGEEIGLLADRFMDRGGRFSFVIGLGGIGQLVAGFPVKGGSKGEMVVVAEETVQDGPAVLEAVDRLVRASVRDMDTVIQGESRTGTLQ